MTPKQRLQATVPTSVEAGAMLMFDDLATPALTPIEMSDRSRWSCSKCQTAFCGVPRERLLDDCGRWRRDHCGTCRRTTVMERV